MKNSTKQFFSFSTNSLILLSFVLIVFSACASGPKYVGQEKDGKPHGEGTYTYPDGSKYVGQFKDGKRDGQGIYTWQRGNVFNKYVGQWKDDKRDGQGTLTWPSDGAKYVGQFKNDKAHGKGTTYDSNGKIIDKGTWHEGKYVGP